MNLKIIHSNSRFCFTNKFQDDDSEYQDDDAYNFDHSEYQDDESVSERLPMMESIFGYPKPPPRSLYPDRRKTGRTYQLNPNDENSKAQIFGRKPESSEDSGSQSSFPSRKSQFGSDVSDATPRIRNTKQQTNWLKPPTARGPVHPGLNSNDPTPKKSNFDYPKPPPRSLYPDRRIPQIEEGPEDRRPEQKLYPSLSSVEAADTQTSSGSQIFRNSPIKKGAEDPEVQAVIDSKIFQQPIPKRAPERRLYPSPSSLNDADGPSVSGIFTRAQIMGSEPLTAAAAAPPPIDDDFPDFPDTPEVDNRKTLYVDPNDDRKPAAK